MTNVSTALDREDFVDIGEPPRPSRSARDEYYQVVYLREVLVGTQPVLSGSMRSESAECQPEDSGRREHPLRLGRQCLQTGRGCPVRPCRGRAVSALRRCAGRRTMGVAGVLPMACNCAWMPVGVCGACSESMTRKSKPEWPKSSAMGRRAKAELGTKSGLASSELILNAVVHVVS